MPLTERNKRSIALKGVVLRVVLEVSSTNTNAFLTDYIFALLKACMPPHAQTFSVNEGLLGK